MKVKCINRGNNTLITEGNEYEIISETENRYSLLNDKGIQKNYAKNLFDAIIEVADVEIIDELTIETNFYDHDLYISIKVGDELFEKSEHGVSIYESSISCGIKELDGLDAVMDFFNNLKEEFEKFLEDNSNMFKLNKDIDLNEIYRDIAKALVQDIIEELDDDALFLLVSTNVSNNDFYNEEIIDALYEVSESTLEGENPNSGNDIKLWTLRC